MKKYLLLIIIGSTLISTAQSLKQSDSLNLLQYDSSVEGYVEYEADAFLMDKSFGQLTLGNFGQQYLLLLAPDNRLDPVRFNEATFLANKPKLIRGNKSFSQIAFANTYNEGALFRATIARPINENWTSTLVFDRNNAVGLYQRESISSNFANMYLGRLNDSLDLQLLFSGSIGTIKRQVNGGIMSNAIFEQNAVTNRELMAVNLNGAEQKLHLLDFKLETPYILYRKADSVDVVSHRIIPKVGFKRTYYIYSDTDPLSGYYQNIYNDSMQTLDSNALDIISAQLNYRYVKNRFQLEAGLAWIRENAFQSYSSKQEWLQGTLMTERQINDGLLEALYQFNLFGTKGHVFRIDYKHPIQDDLHLRMTYSNVADRITPYLYKYRGNHNTWDNKWINPEQSSWTFGVEESKTKYCRVKSTRYINRLYFDKTHSLNQTKEAETVWQVQLAWNWNVSKFNMALQASYQPNISTQPLIAIPELATIATITYKENLFKGALPIKLGLEFNGFTGYYANSYNPSLNNTYLQEDFETPFYPYLDLFLELQVKSAFIKIHYEHINQGLTNYTYYVNSAYARPDRSLLFAVRWSFVN